MFLNLHNRHCGSGSFATSSGSVSKDPAGQCSQEPTDELQQDMDISSRSSKVILPVGAAGNFGGWAAKCRGFFCGFLGAKWVLVQNGYQVHVDQIDLIAREFVSEVGGTNWLPGEMV